MADYEFGADILTDVLFRGGEPVALTGDSVSDYLSAVKSYIQRVHWEAYSWMPWPWAKKYPPGIFQTLAKVTGTCTVTNGSVTVTLSAAIAASMANRKLKIDNEIIPYRIATHTAATATLTLDAAYTEPSGTAVAFTIFQDEYQLVTGVNGAIRPFGFWYRNRPRWRMAFISDDEQRQDGWQYMTANDVRSIALITHDRVRIRPWTEEAKTIEYDYAERQSPLTFDSVASTDTPAVPRDDRHVLSDWALFYLLTDKNDPNASTHLVMVKNKLDAMAGKYFPQAVQRLSIRPRQSVGGRA